MSKVTVVTKVKQKKVTLDDMGTPQFNFVVAGVISVDFFVISARDLAPGLSSGVLSMRELTVLWPACSISRVAGQVYCIPSDAQFKINLSLCKIVCNIFVIEEPITSGRSLNK